MKGDLLLHTVVNTNKLVPAIFWAGAGGNW